VFVCLHARSYACVCLLCICVYTLAIPVLARSFISCPWCCLAVQFVAMCCRVLQGSIPCPPCVPVNKRDRSCPSMDKIGRVVFHSTQIHTHAHAHTYTSWLSLPPSFPLSIPPSFCPSLFPFLHPPFSLSPHSTSSHLFYTALHPLW